MQYDWILEVLTDMRRFAEQNGMPALAEHLRGTSQLAAAEIANNPRASDPAPSGFAKGGTAERF